MENTQSKVDQLTRDAFSILIIVFLLGCIVGFFISIISSTMTTGLFSIGGIIAVFWVYIKWDIIKRTRIKPSKVDEISDLIKADTNSNG
ncbi:MAG: hypothetical protein ABJJ25_15390 [Eudoraea sp.]|uniref:hypothetical protein n=1 Tax=Eudoraea sp. TaxID=1979955 RepID=UPI003265D9D6